MTTQDVLASVHHTTIQILLKEPFYGHFLAYMLKKIDTSIGTLAIKFEQDKPCLYINPIFWATELQDEDLRYGSLKHEILHLVFQHLFRSMHFGEKVIFNIAADIVVNQYLNAKQRIQEAFTLETFAKSCPMLPAQEVGYYYTQLHNFYVQKIITEDTESQQLHSWLHDLITQKTPHRAIKKHCFWQDIRQDLAQDIRLKSLQQSLYQSWQQTENHSLIPIEIIENYVLQATKQYIKPIDWRYLLHIFAYSSKKTQLKNTLKKKSKRYAHALGLKIKPKQKIMVVVDTSESISTQNLRRFFQEIQQIYKRGAELWIVECDTEIRNYYLYRGRIPAFVKGRGNTNFEAPIVWANQVLKPDAIIYFTDGFAPAPKQKIQSPLLWVLSEQGRDPNEMQDFQGRKIKM